MQITIRAYFSTLSLLADAGCLHAVFKAHRCFTSPAQCRSVGLLRSQEQAHEMLSQETKHIYAVEATGNVGAVLCTAAQISLL